jgi:uroporphyrinogen decarboxylase
MPEPELVAGAAAFEPDYRHILNAARNRRPRRLPVYEHLINTPFMERVLGARFADLEGGTAADQREFFRHYCRFFRAMTYDTVSYEVCLTAALPDTGAIMGGRPGPIQNRRHYEAFPWDDIPRRYWALAEGRFRALAETLPPGMKAVGGVGNGVFEISEDLVGYEYLGLMLADDPALIADLYRRIGDLMVTVWTRFLDRHAETFAVCRCGDDLGFKTSTLVAPATIREHIIPQYRRVIARVHSRGKPFLWHSCGCIFDVMEDAIAAGIDAKHSNEDAIAPFDRWIERYGDRIGLLGGIDLDDLCHRTSAEVFDRVVTLGRRFRAAARGFALGSGNSIPDFVPVENYLAMIRAAQHLRAEEAGRRPPA